MKSQWDCLLQNLGEWQGSFTRFSPDGQFLEDTPSVVTLAGREQNQLVHQVVRLESDPPSEKVLEYRSLNRAILFFEDGAFSQGSLQYSPVSEFGAELGLIAGDRRLRVVQLFSCGVFDRLTLIRETRAGCQPPASPAISVEALVGEWQGQAVTMYPDHQPPTTSPTQLQIWYEGRDRLGQRLTIGAAPHAYALASTAQIQGTQLRFDQSQQPFQVLLLPDGASVNCPTQIRPGHPFLLEMGWLLTPKHRQRLIRSYNSKGEWTHCTLVTEEKVDR